jgi:hypothetical protein
MFTHREYAYERACASERDATFNNLWTDSLQICGEHILQVTSSSIGYVFLIFMHRARARARACVRAGAWLKYSLIFGMILFKFAAHMLKMTTSYMGYILIMFTYGGHARARVMNCSPIYGWFLFSYYKSQPEARATFMFAHTRTSACVRARAWLNI